MKTFRIIICFALVACLTGLVSCKDLGSTSTSVKTPTAEELLTELNKSLEAVNAEKGNLERLLENPNCDKGELENAERRCAAALKDYSFRVAELQELDTKGEYRSKTDEATKNISELTILIEKSYKIREGN